MFKRLQDLQETDKLAVAQLWNEVLAQEYDPEVPANVSDTMDKQEMSWTRDRRAEEIANSKSLQELVSETESIANLARSIEKSATGNVQNSDRILLQIRYLQQLQSAYKRLQPYIDNVFNQFTKQEIAAEQAELNKQQNDLK